MKAHITKNADGALVIVMRAEGNGRVGDSVTVVRKGTKLGVATYAQLDALGLGPVEADQITDLVQGARRA